MKKIIIDTNVLISAALKDKSPEKIILYVTSHPKQYQWLASQEIITEYRNVLSRKKLNLSKANQNHWFKLIEAFTTVIDININIEFTRDRKDEKFLTCAIAGKADFLVTGDKDFSDA